MVGAAVGAWLARKLFDPKAVKPPPPYLLQIALRPLEVVMEPFVPGASYQKKVFERFLQHALWSPVASVANQHFLAVGIPVACVVQFAGSLVSLLAFTFIILVLTECEIYALVRTDKMRMIEEELKARMNNVEDKIDRVLQHLSKVSTSAEGDKDETEDSLVESARRGDLNKVHTSAEGEEKSLLEAVRGGDLNKVKELLADRGCDPHSLSNAWVSGQETFANRSRAGLGKNRRFISGTRPLIAAAALGHSHVVWELLVSRADVNATDSDGLTALSAAFCSPDCNIHTWFLLHHAADQTFKKSDQSSDAQADIQNDDDWTLLLGNMNARTDEKRALCMLVTLLRGEGQIFTDMVAGLLKEVEPGRYRSERLKERMRTVLCDYALVTGYGATKLFNGRGRHTTTHFQFPSFAMCSHLAPDTQVQKFLEDRGRAPRKSMYVLQDDRAKKPEDVDAFNLSWHNMLYAPEVQVSLRSLPIAAPLACEPSVLAALAETENDETLQTDTVEAIAAAAWLQMRVATAVDSFLNCVALGCLCLVTWACRKEDMDAQPMPALWVLAMIQFKEGVEFLSQLGFYCWSCLSCRRVDMEIAIAVRRRIFRHVPVNGKEMKLLSDEDVSFVQHPAPSLETLADFFFLVAGFFAIYGQMDRCSDGELEPIFLPGLCSMYWLRLLYSLRGERWLGPYLLPILSAVRDTGAFFFVTSLCVASATHAYVIMNPRGDDDFPVYSAFTHTVRLAIFGDFDLFEYQGQDTTFEQVEGEWAPNDPSPKDLEQLPYIYLQLCFFCTGIGITVLLMNLLLWCMVQLRPWTRVGAWLGGKLFDPEVRGPPPLCLHLVTLAEIALRPLKVVMEPFVPEAYYQKNVFERFLQRALWSPVAKQNFLAVGIPVVCAATTTGTETSTTLSTLTTTAASVTSAVTSTTQSATTATKYDAVYHHGDQGPCFSTVTAALSTTATATSTVARANSTVTCTTQSTLIATVTTATAASTATCSTLSTASVTTFTATDTDMGSTLSTFTATTATATSTVTCTLQSTTTVTAHTVASWHNAVYHLGDCGRFAAQRTFPVSGVAGLHFVLSMVELMVALV
ncbi:hypothetical protein AK812_SmicGene36260 [Symbiodinium microadriaticum]|uniref:Uncharacterized protein n=1 Tax=Symbiodinium microadriaticum TaxID=2951 RepID=A0A1Q9CJF9_SYMMI|nr:hypothetical protein AK812_SmicGene36260 [Symbiodinium microadriaticum]